MNDGTIIGWGALLLGFVLVCLLAKIATTLSDMHDSRERDRVAEAEAKRADWFSGARGKLVKLDRIGRPPGGDAA